MKLAFVVSELLLLLVLFLGTFWVACKAAFGVLVVLLGPSPSLDHSLEEKGEEEKAFRFAFLVGTVVLLVGWAVTAGAFCLLINN
jgi:hypothetical protein